MATHRGKQAAAEAALEWVTEGMTLGLGTGSTAEIFIRRLGERVAQGLAVSAVATSRASDLLAREVGISMIALERGFTLDLTIDGADECDPQRNLIKGGGAALLREKIVAYHSRRMLVIADESKYVERLGRFPLPVEVVPFWWQSTSAAITALGVQPVLREANGVPLLTDNGNQILDCPFGAIDAPAELERALLQIPGVVDVGLFCGMASAVFLGRDDGSIRHY